MFVWTLLIVQGSCRNLAALSPLKVKFTGKTLINPKKYKNSKTIGDVTIDDGYEVIGSEAFYGSSITSVSLPPSITTLEISAFDSCLGLTEFVMNEGLKFIYQRAVRRCNNLQVIRFSSTVQAVESGAFMHDDNAEVYVPPESQYFVFEDSILYNKDKSVIHWCQNHKTEFTFPLTVLTTKQDAFRDCDLLRTVVWESATELAGYTFRFCGNLTNVTFGVTFSVVSSTDFTSCTALENIFVDPKNPHFGSTDGILLVKDKSGGLTDVAIFPAHNPSTSFTVQTTMTQFNAAAFGSSKIDTFAVEDGHSKYVEWNGMVYSKDFSILYAVPPCIKSFSFHDNINEIGESAFQYNVKVKELDIPERIHTIKKSAFAGAYTTRVTLTDKVEFIGSGCFSGSSLKYFRLPQMLTTVPMQVVTYSSVTNATLHDGVTVIGSTAFGNSQLRYIELPKSLIEIKANAFAFTFIDGKEIEFCGNLQYIRNNAFEACMEITNVVIPASVIAVESQAFYTCGSLEMVTIKNCATVIGYQAFYGANETFQSICIQTRFFTMHPGDVSVSAQRMALAYGILVNILLE